LLINPPYRESIPAAVFPSGFGYIASVLLKGGHDVSVLDINGYRYLKSEVEDKIKGANFDLFATGGLITKYKYVKWLCNLIKKYHPNKFVVVGGALATSAPELVINKMDANAIILGEGENTILELANALEKKSNLKEVNGLWFMDGKKVMKNDSRKLIKDLDSLPFPVWDLFPIENYLKTPFLTSIPAAYKSINISTVRGCPFACKFCYNVFGKRTSRTRSVDSIISEIKFLQNKYGVKAFMFCDDLFTVNKTRVFEFCNKVINQQLNILWRASSRVDTIDEEMLVIMKRSGCVGISFGLESGSQKVLESIGKGITVEQSKKAVRLMKKVGIPISSPFMIGAPVESVETIKETVNFIKEMDLFVPTIFIINPYHGSEFYDYAMKKGLIKDEERFAERCGEALDLSVNLTTMSDADLLFWRDWAVKTVIKAYRKRHPLKALALDLNKINRTFKNFGLIGTLRKVSGRIRRGEYNV